MGIIVMSTESIASAVQNGAPVPYKPKSRRGAERAYIQMLELQELMLADAHNPETKASVRAQIARSVCMCEEEKRKLKMRPLPKPIDTEKLRKVKHIVVQPEE
jgi:hypothetical protein